MRSFKANLRILYIMKAKRVDISLSICRCFFFINEVSSERGCCLLMSRERLLHYVSKKVYTPLVSYDIQFALYKGDIPFSKIDTLSFKAIQVGEVWGTLFDRAWFRLSLKEMYHHKENDLPLVLMLDIGGEGLVYDHVGFAMMGITNKMSSYGIPPDKPGKWIVPVTDDKIQTIYIDASCNDLFGYVQNGGRIQHAELGCVHPRWHKIFYDLEVLIDWELGISETGNHQPSRTAEQKIANNPHVTPLLNDIENMLFTSNEPLIFEIERRLDTFYKSPSKHTSLDIIATGHAHLDIAWMWSIEEGRRKARRTFTTALSMMDRYPKYIFGASQYQLFDWIRQDYPQLFSRIRDRVQEGRFELQGVFWVESDLNIPSLESLIRQIYYGRQFTKHYFNKDINFVWEPDVFGLSGALPQILIKSGVRFICSQKLSQNKINPFPYHSFKWEGIDGSMVMVHHFPEETYDSRMRPASVLKLFHQYKEKDTIPHALMVFGIGDGGGGPGEEHLERYNRICNIDGLPKISMNRVSHFIDIWSKDVDKMSNVKGELYFERHQGTYTTEVLNKIGNETMERLLNQYEQLSAWLWYFEGVPVDQIYLDQTWKEVLLYQFHDILPGSSIMPVYHSTRKRYRELILELTKRIEKSMNLFIHKLSSQGWTVFNPTGWIKKDWIKIDQQWFYYEVAPFAWNTLSNKQIKTKKVIENILNNGLVKVTINHQGVIESIIKLDTMDEMIDKNRLQSMWIVYHELAEEYAAWDFADHYRQGQKGYPKIRSIETITEGPLQQILIHYDYQSSMILMTVSLYDDSPLIKITCSVDWHETNTSLKFQIPITVHSDYATCHMQYGNIHRPTHSEDSYAAAKDEIYAHQFVDISNEHCGIAMIVPQKYGYRVKDQSLEVTILRSQKKNGSELGFMEDSDYLEMHYGDLVAHTFTMGILPHPHDLLLVEQYADQLKNEVWITHNESRGSLEMCPLLQLTSPYVTIESIKVSYDKQGLILRLIEHSGHSCSFDVLTSLRYSDVWLCDMQEVMLQKINMEHLQIKGYEVLTLKLIKESN